MKALIVYCSRTGHTEQAAQDIARGLASRGVEVDLRKAKEADPGSVKDYEVLLVGTPTYGHRLYRSAAAPVASFMNSLPPEDLMNKVVGAFSVNASSGGGLLVKALESKLAGKGAHVVTGGPVVTAGSTLSLRKGPDAKPADVKKCEEFGARVAEGAQGK